MKNFILVCSITLSVSTGLLLYSTSSFADIALPAEDTLIISMSDPRDGLGPYPDISISERALPPKDTPNSCNAEKLPQSKLTNNLIVNGSFESPKVDGWSVFPEIEGWKTIIGPGIEIQANSVAGKPFHGLQFAELDSDANSVIEQMVLTQPQTKYCLVFAYSPRPGVDWKSEGLRVWINKKVVSAIKVSGMYLPDTQWHVNYVGFKSSESHMPTSLRFEPLGDSDSMGVYLDGVEMYDIRD